MIMVGLFWGLDIGLKFDLLKYRELRTGCGSLVMTTGLAVETVEICKVVDIVWVSFLGNR